MPSDPPTAQELLGEAKAALRTMALDDVRGLFARAQQVFEDAGDTRGRAQCWIEEARAVASSDRLKDREDARRLLRRAQETLDAVNDPDLQARWHHVRGYLQLRSGYFDEAFHALSRALRSFQESGNRRAEAQVLDTIGMLHEQRSNGERAALSLAQSLAIKQRLDDRQGMAISLGNLGRLALRSATPQEAEGFFRLDLDIARAVQDVRGEALVRANLAEALLEQGHRIEAARAASQASALARQVGDRVSQAYARLALANVALAEGNEYQARTEGQAALRIFAEEQMRPGKAAARLLLARVEQAEDNPARSAALALAAAATARRAGDARGALRALLLAHTELARDEQHARRARVLAKAHDVAAASHQAPLADMMRTQQAAQDVTRALSPEPLSLRIGAATGAFADRVGDVVPFTIENYLGTNHTASVFHVREVGSDRSFAWKQMHGGPRRAAAHARRLRYQIRARERLVPNKHVVALHAYAQHGEAPGALLDWVRSPGRHGTLRAVLDDVATLAPDAATRVVHDVAKGLAALHAAEVPHGDIQPGNVLFGDERRAVLADADLPLRVEHAAAAVATVRDVLAYTAPELVTKLGEWVPGTLEADVYALGVLLYRLVSGRWPIPIDGDFATVRKSKLEHDIDLDVLPKRPKALAPLVRRMCARDPAKRPSAEDVVAALRAVRAGADA